MGQMPFLRLAFLVKLPHDGETVERYLFDESLETTPPEAYSQAAAEGCAGGHWERR